MSLIAKAKPTPAHMILSGWEKKGGLIGIATQNVDGLHQRAGSSNVIELHGSIWRVRCASCGRRYNLGFGNVPREELPRCNECGGLLRPDVVWFQEPIPLNQFERAERMFSKALLVLVIGTSGKVMPAALLPINASREGKSILEINPEETDLSELARIRIRESASKALQRIAHLVEEEFIEDRRAVT